MEKRKKKQKDRGTGLSGRSLSRIISSGGVVFKKVNNQVLWLVTKTNPSVLYPKTWWRLPKGWIDDEDGGKNPGPLTRGETKATENELIESALREVQEEAGVLAKVVNKITTEKYFYSPKDNKKIKIFKLVIFYLMEWVSDLRSGYGAETSEIVWLPYSEARKRLTQSGERKVLDVARENLNSGIQNSLI